MNLRVVFTLALVLALAPLAAQNASKAKDALNKDKYGKDSNKGPGPGSKASYGGESGASVIKDEEKPVWEKNDKKVLEKVAKDKKPVVLFFLEEGTNAADATKVLHGEDVAKLSKTRAVFILIDFNADRTPSLDTGCPIPVSKLAGPNPSRDYAITSTPCWLVCDEFGNEYARFKTVPDAKQLQGKIDSITEMRDAINKRLEKTLADGKKALADKDNATFLKAALKNFNEGVIGLPAQDDTIRAYRDLLDETRKEVDAILADKPKDAEKRLRALEKDFKGTELVKEIKDAIDIVKGR